MNHLSSTALETEPLLRVPFVIAGKLVDGDRIRHRSRDLGADFVTPEIDLNRIAPWRGEPAPAESLKVAEIMDFLVEVGKRLTLDNPHMRYALERAEPVSTLARPLLTRCYGDLAKIFDREFMEISVEADIGSEALDGWKRIRGINGRENFVHAIPPRLVHVMAGNAPEVTARTIVYGALMKGINLMKMPSNDLFTATAILRTMADIDPDHPVLRSFSAVYWRGGDDTIESVLYRPQFFDKVIVWGGEKAVRHVQKYAGPGFQIVTWDPKTSISMIGHEAFASEETLREVAALAATDATVIDQDACIASRYQYIEGSVEEADRFCALLIRELGKERAFCSAKSPPTLEEVRSEVEVLRLLEPDYRVWGDYSGGGLVVRSLEPVTFFPDRRTVNVVPVASLRDAVRFANVATQSVGVYPPERKAEIRDRLGDFGVQRLGPLGQIYAVPAGSPHDGTYEMQRLVRWIIDEGPLPAP